MAIQYKERLSAYAVGRRVNMEEWNAITRVKQGSSLLPFGSPVMAGTENGTCNLLDATTGRNILGIAETSQVLGHVGDHYEEYDNVSICESGVIGALLGGNVTQGAQARWDTVAGKWTAAAQSATVVTIPGAQFDESGSSGEVGVIRYRRPVPSLSVSGA